MRRYRGNHRGRNRMRRTEKREGLQWQKGERAFRMGLGEADFDGRRRRQESEKEGWGKRTGSKDMRRSLKTASQAEKAEMPLVDGERFERRKEDGYYRQDGCMEPRVVLAAMKRGKPLKPNVEKETLGATISSTISSSPAIIGKQGRRKPATKMDQVNSTIRLYTYKYFYW
ncbi:hypothetical protein HPP92_020575 [Vanilla planifolia]|uniref:Uncharacterized protein n=1 Tax=Vanilla planifolia TaxID=51239 RepID=A0A835UGE0_VANPL|nr:hypothetical protein HPP92_020575 [Vanilla planifolia]